MREFGGMGFAFRVLAFGVESSSAYRYITARLLVRTRRIGFLRGREAGCAAQKNHHRPKTRSAAQTHELSLQLLRSFFAQYSGGSKRCCANNFAHRTWASHL